MIGKHVILVIAIAAAILENVLGLGLRRNVGARVDPGSFTALFQNAAIDDRLEFPLQARRTRSDELCQFGEIPPLVRLGERRRKHLSPSRGEKRFQAAILRKMRQLLRKT